MSTAQTINMNDKSKVKNLAPWDVSWLRTNGTDEFIKGNASVYIANDELEMQRDAGNRFFVGTDGLGSHATVYIENPEMREYLNFDSKEENREQFILNDDACQKLFDYKTIKKFKEKLVEDVITNQEKTKIVDYAIKVKLNEFDKVQALEEHTGLKVRQ